MGQDDHAHLVLGDKPDSTLCGLKVSDSDTEPGRQRPCPDCAKELLTLIFRHPGRLRAFDVVVED